MSEQKVNIQECGFNILQIETCASCNMNCRFCAYPIKQNKKSILDYKIVNGLIDSIEPHEGFEYICFSHFNEPLLDDRVYSFIKHARQKRIPVLIITNGLLFQSKNVIQKLIESQPNRIKISLQTLNAKSFHEVRQVKSSFDKYKKGIFEFLSAGVKTPIEINLDVACNFLARFKKTTATVLGLRQGDPHVYSTIHDAKDDIKAFLFELSCFDNRFEYNEQLTNNFINNVISDYKNQYGLDFGKNVKLKIKIFWHGRRLKEYYPVRRDVGCSSSILGVLSDGNVVPCCWAYDKTLSLGNVYDNSLSVILKEKREKIQQIRSGTNTPVVCKKCFGAPTKRGALMRDLKLAK